jgi:hypothetical protein
MRTCSIEHHGAENNDGNDQTQVDESLHARGRLCQSIAPLPKLIDRQRCGLHLPERGSNERPISVARVGKRGLRPFTALQKFEILIHHIGDGKRTGLASRRMRPAHHALARLLLGLPAIQDRNAVT